MTCGAVGKHSANESPDGYVTAWSGDLADDMPTQTLQLVDDLSLSQGWAKPTPEFLAQLLEALKRRL